MFSASRGIEILRSSGSTFTPRKFALTAGILGSGIIAFKLMNNSNSISGGAQASLETSTGGSGLQTLPKTFGGFNFLSLRLHSVESLNHNTKKLRFELPNPEACSGLPLTSALLTISRPKGAWLPVVRPYTPVSDADEIGFVELVVKQYPNGKASTHLHSLTPGDSLLFAGPIKGYQWKTNERPHIALIAGGAGITPMYQLIRGILKNPAEKTRITLVWGANTDADTFFADEFTELEKKYPGRFNVHYTISHPEENSRFQQGYINKEFLEKANLAVDTNDTKVFVCGPPAMESAILGAKGNGKEGILSQLGYKSNQIHKF